MVVAFSRFRLFLVTVCLLAAGLWSQAGLFVIEWRSFLAGGIPEDAETHDDREYRSLVAVLPERGVVGYVAPADWPSAPSQRAFYGAQYTLTPRLLQIGIVSEFVIVPPGAVVDDRLVSYVPFARSEHGEIRVFRRVG
jgi:hypothetical protein